MFFSIRKSLKKVRFSTALSERVDALEKRLSALEIVCEERDSLLVYVEEIKRQEEEAYQVLQNELEDIFVQNMKPRGEA
mgnify:CR=1 FL=1|tara:strand:- start:1224 stop:1460 length:237 start_codon:yes stop_codon:yes gene_type:complete